VGESGAAFGVVDGTGVYVGVEGDHGRLVAFEDDEVHAVGEGEFSDALREFLEVLGRKRSGQDEWEEEGDFQFHSEFSSLYSSWMRGLGCALPVVCSFEKTNPIRNGLTALAVDGEVDFGIRKNEANF